MPVFGQRGTFLLGVPIGLILGLGSFTFQYAGGLGYLGNNPATCANCHIMNEQYDGWLKSSHHGVATCNDCHTPHAMAGKYLSKAVNGFNHARAFTLQNFHEPIRITPFNASRLQDNCVRCHQELTSHISAVEWDGMGCVHCHRSVGHGSGG
jgi:cytochrome c nitrite reductase small subunit